MSYIYTKQSGDTVKYRVYYMYQSKKIYIGIYETSEKAQEVYAWVDTKMSSGFSLEDYLGSPIAFDKFITLLNFKNNGAYFSVPIYIFPDHFKYYLSEDFYMIFSLKDLFFISNYKIHKRGQYLYINIGTRQENLLKRFGISNHATYGVDYLMHNGNRYDLRRENIHILNHYKGVQYEDKYHTKTYVARIRTTQYLVIGHYDSELLAAIAYNKAVDYLEKSSSSCSYEKNEFPFLTRQEYQSLYDKVEVSKRLTHPSHQNRIISPKNYRGISKDKSGYRALIGFGGKQIYLGIYPTEKRAAQAYNYASLYLFGSQGYVNKLSPLTHQTDQEKIAFKLQKAGVLKQQPKKA